ncbi:MAG: 4-(cytidine 5'-diphospho)-2-C-methyl-D-erythritol kinase [Ruminiclostridium sp.]|nr:4-(cytidine 5'-diphospho)-2-C-methyl-D-erythritol kinase [Ruminiclostridium sp.]
MASTELFAYAKINLSLDVIGKRDDGYHELRMIMQSIKLHDIVHIETAASGIAVSCDNKQVPSDLENIAGKAALLITGKFGIKGGLKIYVKKNIPVAAGLAGGSADAAAVLKGINDLFSLGVSNTGLMAMGKQIGADVPFCIAGGTMLAEGIGEKLTALASFSGVNLVLIKPKIGVSTAWVYKNLDIGKIINRPDTEKLIAALGNSDINQVAANMKNVLEGVTIPSYNVIQEAKDRLIEMGAIGSMMSGSGPAVFGIFTDRHKAEKAYKATKDSRWDRFLTKSG